MFLASTKGLVWTQWVVSSTGFTWNQIFWHLDLGLPCLQNYWGNKNYCCSSHPGFDSFDNSLSTDILLLFFEVLLMKSILSHSSLRVLLILLSSVPSSGCLSVTVFMKTSLVIRFQLWSSHSPHSTPVLPTSTTCFISPSSPVLLSVFDLFNSYYLSLLIRLYTL